MRSKICLLIFLLTLTVTDAQDDMSISWIGNTYGGGNNQWVQNLINGMFVAPDGTVFLNSEWDEGAGEAGVYREGQRLGSLPQTHGWGRFGGHTVTADDRYIYVAITQSGCDGGDDELNENGLSRYPFCDAEGQSPLWLSVRRHDRESFEIVPLPSGYGTMGEQLLVDIVEAGIDELPISGLAVYENELFVSSPQTNQIKVYSTDTFELLRQFNVERPNEIAVDAAGDLWILQRDPIGLANTPLISRYSNDGTPHPKQITFDVTSQPTAIAFDNQGRLLVTDNGVRQQVLIYGNLDSQPTIVDTFGTEGGIYSGVPGEIKPLKLYDLQGIGVDEEGNFYIGMGSYRSGTHLQSYTPGGELRWEVMGLFFVDSVGIDPKSDGMNVYGKHERFVLDYSTTIPGTEATYIAYTLNPFKYPDDIRNFSMPTNVFVQYVHGQRFLYMTDMYSSYIAVYRFEPTTDGEIAIPSVLFVKESMEMPNVKGEPETGTWIWRDANGDGSFDPDEYDVQPSPHDNVFAWGWWIDTDGTVWRANREDGIRSFPAQGLDEHGNPLYSFATSIYEENPAPFNVERDYRGDINRLLYYPETDTLYLTGYTVDYPNDNDEWGQLGRIIVRYDDWSSGNRRPDWELVPTWSLEMRPTGLDIAGDYIFLAYTNPEPSYVDAYHRSSGEFVMRFSPNEIVGNFSGWFDIRYPLRTIQRVNGEYIIFAEEDGRGKNIIYRWNP